MAGVRAIEGVDNTLVNIANAAVEGLSPRPTVTVGPLDRDDEVLRINWFLYAVRPNPAYRNMEPPRTGATAARGQPPLSLELSYALTAHPGTLTASGQQSQFADRGLAAVMQALHDNPIITEDAPTLAAEAAPLVEPLRVTMEGLDLDALSKLWTSAARPMRTCVGYRVSLTVVDSIKTHLPGPPVRERRLTVAPSLGPRITALSPTRVSAESGLDVALSGGEGQVTFSLRREDADPPGPGAWVLPASRVGPDTHRLQVTPAELAPGPRRLIVTSGVEGLPAGTDRAGVTVVPVVTGPTGAVAAGSTVSLATAHADADVEVFFDGVRLSDVDVTFVSPTQVDIVVPSTAAAGQRTLMLRSAFTAGSAFDGLAVS